MYRLSSPAFLQQEIRIWEDERGSLIAFAVWLPSFRMLDYGFDPRADAPLADDVLQWVEAWFTMRAREAGSPQACWIKTRQNDALWSAALERRGFARCAWSMAHLERTLQDSILRPEPAEGFHIRQVAAGDIAACVELHRSVFPRAGMTPEWRHEMMRAAAYRSDLDLVAIGADSRLAAFCVGWIGLIGTERVGQIEPLGTHPAYREKRLGRAVLTEVMRRMRDHEARRVMVETWDDNMGAIHSYETGGFRQTSLLPTYGKDFS